LRRKSCSSFKFGFVKLVAYLTASINIQNEAAITEHQSARRRPFRRGYENRASLATHTTSMSWWRVQVDVQSGSDNSSTIGFTWNVTPDFQFQSRASMFNRFRRRSGSVKESSHVHLAVWGKGWPPDSIGRCEMNHSNRGKTE